MNLAQVSTRVNIENRTSVFGRSVIKNFLKNESICYNPFKVTESYLHLLIVNYLVEREFTQL